MLVESYIYNNFGRWQSVGVSDSTADELLAFYRTSGNDNPRLGIKRVTREGEMVIIIRGILLSGVETERTECLFPDEDSAIRFEGAMLGVLSQNCAVWGQLHV